MTGFPGMGNIWRVMVFFSGWWYVWRVMACLFEKRILSTLLARFIRLLVLVLIFIFHICAFFFISFWKKILIINIISYTYRVVQKKNTQLPPITFHLLPVLNNSICLTSSGLSSITSAIWVEWNSLLAWHKTCYVALYIAVSHSYN